MVNPSEYWKKVFKNASLLSRPVVAYLYRGINRYNGKLVLEKFHQYIPGYASDFLKALNTVDSSKVFIFDKDDVSSNGHVAGRLELFPATLKSYDIA